MDKAERTRLGASRKDTRKKIAGIARYNTNLGNSKEGNMAYFIVIAGSCFYRIWSRQIGRG